MKIVSAWCLMVVSLVLAAGEIRAADAGQNYRWPQNQTAPNQTVTSPNSAAVPAVVPQSPPATQPSPSRVTQKPSGVLNKPSGVPNRSPGVTSPMRGPTQPTPGQNFVGGQRDYRRFPHDGDFHDRNFHHGTFRGRHSNWVIVYVNGAPCWYPVYTEYPYYYAAPVSSTYYGNGYSTDSGYIPLAEQSDAQTASGYDEVGRQWGQDLRREIGTWEQFVDYLRTYIINAAPGAQADFREAFIASYGINGAAAYDKAADQAAQTSLSSQGPKIINMPSGY